MTSWWWTDVQEKLPPDGQIVEVKTPGGDVRDLVLRNNLWWLPDETMYVYFVPTHWRVK